MAEASLQNQAGHSGLHVPVHLDVRGDILHSWKTSSWKFINMGASKWAYIFNFALTI